MTLVTSQVAIQAVIIQSYIIYEHGGKNLGFTIWKLGVESLNEIALFLARRKTKSKMAKLL